MKLNFNKMSNSNISHIFVCNGPFGFSWRPFSESSYVEGPSIMSVKVLRQKIRLSKISKICHNMIARDFVLQNLNKAHTLAVVMCTKASCRDVHAFILCRDLSDTSFILDVICSEQGLGTFILQSFLDYLDTVAPSKHIEVHAMPNVFTWYTKFGFTFRDSCDTDEIELPKYMIRALPKMKDHTMQECYDHAICKKTLERLFEHGLQANDGPECSSLEKSIRNDCPLDGFQMIRCRTKASDTSWLEWAFSFFWSS